MRIQPRVAVMLDLDWPFKRHAETFAGTQLYAQEHGWESVVDEFVSETLAASRSAVPYDGIIARATRNLASRAKRLKIPIVNVWISSPVWDKLPGVFPDFAAMGRQRAEHLLARGFQRFAVLTSRSDRAQVIESQAFARLVNEAGYPCLAEYCPLHFSSATVKQWRKNERTIDAWMKRWEPPVGVYVGSEIYGRIVAQMCHRRGFRVPQDVAIIAGANETNLCEYLRPTLTSMDAGYDRIGYEAARLLDHLMGGGALPVGPILQPAKSLVVRESTDFYAINDELIASALAFIAAKSHLAIGPSEVAEAVNTHPRTLQRRFHRILRRPIATEIRRVRIERAKRELVQSTRSLSQIAREVGFGDTLRMYEVFKRELGTSPSEYRSARRTTGTK